MKGFRDFVLRGNLIELAVAFIIGAAFAALVDAFTKVILEAIGKATGGADFNFDDWAAGRLVDDRAVPHRPGRLPHHGVRRLLLHRHALREGQGRSSSRPSPTPRRSTPTPSCSARSATSCARPAPDALAPDGPGLRHRRSVASCRATGGSWRSQPRAQPPRRVTPSAGGAARAASGRAGVSPGVGSARGGTTSGASSADGLVPARSARRRRAGDASVSRLGRARRAPACSDCPAARRPSGSAGSGGSVVTGRLRTPRPRGSGTRRGPGRGRRRSTTPAGAASRAARAARRAAGRGRGWCASRRTAARRTRRRAPAGPARAGSSTARSTGSADEPDVLVHDQPVAAQPPGQVGEHDGTGAGTRRPASTASDGVADAPTAGTPGSGPPAA